LFCELSPGHDSTLSSSDIRRLGDLRGEEEKMRRLEYTKRLMRDALAVVGFHDRIASVELVKGQRTNMSRFIYFDQNNFGVARCIFPHAMTKIQY
jgi:hypothetical protein